MTFGPMKAWRLVFALALVMIAGCGGDSGGGPADASQPTDGGTKAPDAGPVVDGATRVTPAHPGWKNPHCLECHDGSTAPLPHEPSRYEPPDCVGCHGFNGARHRDHAGDPVANCAECHATGAIVPDHLDDFEMPTDCAVCHVHPASPEGL